MRFGFLLVAVGGVFAAGLLGAAPPQPAAPQPTAAVPAPEPADRTADRTADREAIVRSSLEFATAFGKGDAKALAALWTEGGEYEGEDGAVVRGRPAIEASFAAHFAGRPAGKMEIQVESIRFLSRDTAVEEGLSRTSAPDMLPTSAYYRVLHVREDGKWAIVQSREWGSAHNRLADLDWLIGSWRSQAKAPAKDATKVEGKDPAQVPAQPQETTVTFALDPSGSFVVGEFTASAAGKSTSLGTMRIGIDRVSGRFKSWHFDPDGGHGEGVWIRDGRHWTIDSHGVRGDGTDVTSVNVLTRLAGDRIGWRSIERTAAGRPLPDSAPVVLTRAAAAK